LIVAVIPRRPALLSEIEASIAWNYTPFRCSLLCWFAALANRRRADAAPDERRAGKRARNLIEPQGEATPS
jgi:hypothetical protein